MVSWSRPPNALFGDEKPECLYAALGLALSNWELVEFELSKLVSLMTGDLAGLVEALNYGAVGAFQGRRKKLDDAVRIFARVHPSHPVLIATTALSVELVEASQRRNELAHGIVVHTHCSWTQTSKEVGVYTVFCRGYFLLPAYYRNRHFFGEESLKYAEYSYSSNEIDLIGNCFVDLRRRVEVVSEIIQS